MANATVSSQTLNLDDLSADVRISKQTLVQWTDRGLIDAELDWGLSETNEEVRLIQISEASLDFLRGFAVDYRDETVSRTDARRHLKLIDRNQVQKLIRQGSIKTKSVDEETRIAIGSVEDYLMSLEAEEESD